ncbi:sigma-E factor negative regulatory protein RseA [Gammaproteobacteria bacterium]
MTNAHEHLSALMDGELETDPMESQLAALAQDASLRARWDRYHLIGDAIRGEALRYDAEPLADRVRAALDREPATSSPCPLSPLPRRPHRDWGSVSATGSRLRRLKRRDLLPIAAVLALAALGATWLSNLHPPSGRKHALYAARTLTHHPEALSRLEVEKNHWFPHHGTTLSPRLREYLATHQRAIPGIEVRSIAPSAKLVGMEAHH